MLEGQKTALFGLYFVHVVGFMKENKSLWTR